MEPPQRRDINELLVNGYFKTSRARSPAGSTPTSSSTSFLHVADNTPRDRSRDRSRERSRSHGPRRRPPPRPTVEDEAVSLAKESSTSPLPSYDPPLRGVIDQHPIILEADVSAAEAARLHKAKDNDDNPERRFVLVPTDPKSPTREDAPQKPARPKQAQPVRKEGENLAPRPPIERRRSRQDLPSLQTKVPRDIPSQFRRSASAYASVPRDNDETPKARTANESLLSPDVQRNPSNDYFGSAPRYGREDSFGGKVTPLADKRKSGGSINGTPRPMTPNTEKRNSGNFDKQRSRRDSNEKLTRPQQISEGEYRRRGERHPSTHSARLSTGSDRRSGRNSPRPYTSSSESEAANSDSDRGSRNYRHHRHRELQVDTGSRRSSPKSNRGSTDFKSSRYSGSPLPSPRVSPSQLPRADRERAETFPQRSGSRSPVSRPVSPFTPNIETPRSSGMLDPLDVVARPRSRQAHTISNPIPTPTYPNAPYPLSAPYPGPSSSSASLPMPIPMPSAPYERGRPQYDDLRASSAQPTEQKPFWQPPPFQPNPNTLQKPVGSYRRHSEDVERGTVAPLPSCPRTKFKQGLNDWLTLPQCPSFDICPSCFNSTIAPTEFRNFFVPAPRRSVETEVLCDFGSSPWYRIAWLLTRKERRRDLNLFYGLAHVANNAPPCLGKHDAVRQWHSLLDPKTRAPVQNFHVCYSCVRSIEVLLPPLRGIFIRLDPKRPMGDLRVCDLRFDSKRFVQYFDALETTADKAVSEVAPPDTRPLVSLAKRLAMFPECERDADLVEQPWNIITQLPEFTVCEECFDEVVWPELEDEKAIPMMFSKKLPTLPMASCQLYSPKMRGIFRTAVDGNDYKLLAQKARERKAVEMKYKKDIDNLRRLAAKGGNSQGIIAEIRRLEEEWRKWE